MRFVITGGGTGGHLVIAAVLEKVLSQRGHEVIFIGSSSGQDRMWFEKGSGFTHTYFLPTTGVVNQKGLGKVAALWRIGKAFMRSRALLKEFDAVGVISVGGFSAAPASFAALSRRVPLFIHEQNAETGRLNALLKPYARVFFSSYEPTSPVKAYPVNKVLFEKARLRTSLQRIIFLGGSQGATYINDLALSIAPLLQKRGIAIIHQCGERDLARLQSAYAEMGIEVELMAFSKKLPDLLERSDFAISRAGASTLWELCANGLPAFFIPYPYAAADHQYYNAQFIVQKELGWSERQGDTLKQKLIAVLDEELSSRSKKLMDLIEPEGAEKIIEVIESEV